jgi:hypothetical protein
MPDTAHPDTAPERFKGPKIKSFCIERRREPSFLYDAKYLRFRLSAAGLRH